MVVVLNQGQNAIGSSKNPHMNYCDVACALIYVGIPIYA